MRNTLNLRVLITDVLEIVGLVLVVAAVAVEAWTVTPALGLASAGAGLVGVSALLVWLGHRP